MYCLQCIAYNVLSIIQYQVLLCAGIATVLRAPHLSSTCGLRASRFNRSVFTPAFRIGNFPNVAPLPRVIQIRASGCGSRLCLRRHNRRRLIRDRTHNFGRPDWRHFPRFGCRRYRSRCDHKYTALQQEESGNMVAITNITD